MASSPLTLAMLGGLTGGGGQYGPYGMAMYDPATLGAMQRLQMGQGLVSSGLDASPAYPMQGVARLAQALLGQYVMQQGFGELQDVQKQQNATIPSTIDWIRNGGGAMPAPAAPATAPQQPTSGAPVTQEPLQPPAKSAGTEGTNYLALYGNPNVPDWGKSNLTTITAPSGAKFTVNKIAAPAFAGFLTDLEKEGYKVNPETSGGYNLRNITGGTTLSPHAYGVAIDINPSENPYSKTAQGGTLTTNMPPNVEKLAQKWGLQWGGDWKSLKDPMHFEYVGQPQTQVAQAGNVMTDASPGGAGAAPQAMPPNTQTGAQNARVQQILGRIQRARDILSSHPMPLDRLHQAAQAELENAQQELQIGQWHPDPHNANIMRNDVTGEVKPIFSASPRFSTTPTGETLVGMPGGGVETLPPNNAGVAAFHSAQTQGAKAGEAAGELPEKLATMSTESARAIGTIDSATRYLDQAQKAGLPTGYFAPWMADAAAAGRYLGIDMKNLGINPEAVTDIQAARKSLAIVSGEILRDIMGQGQRQITNRDLQQFIAATPGIETDPQALQKILGWARSQALFNNNMAIAGLRATDPNTGMIPPGWHAAYIAKLGAGGPIFDPLSGEMKQPSGEGEAQTSPVAAPKESQKPAEPQSQQPTRAEIEAEMRRRALIK